MSSQRSRLARLQVPEQNISVFSGARQQSFIGGEVERALNRGEQGIMDELSRQFEKALIAKALAHTGGRRVEAASLLGLGRNTLTRKIQELGLEDRPDKDD